MLKFDRLPAELRELVNRWPGHENKAIHLFTERLAMGYTPAQAAADWRAMVAEFWKGYLRKIGLKDDHCEAP